MSRRRAPPPLSAMMIAKSFTLADSRRAVEKLKEAEIPPVKCEDCGTPCYVLLVGFGFTAARGPVVCRACGERRKNG